MKLAKILVLLLISLALSGHAVHPYEDQLEGASASAVIQKAISYDRTAKEREIDDLGAVNALIQSKAGDLTPDTIVERVRSRLLAEQTHISAVTGDKSNPLSLQYGKIGAAVTDILDHYLSPENVGKLLAGHSVYDSSLTEDTFPAILERQATLESLAFWGTTKVARTALFSLFVAGAVMGEETHIEGVLRAANVSLQDSPMVHAFSLGQSFDVTALENSFLYAPSLRAFALTGLFQFGAGHNHAEEAPQTWAIDGSSFVEKALQTKSCLATLYPAMAAIHQLDHDLYQRHMGQIRSLEGGKAKADDIETQISVINQEFEAVSFARRQPGDVIVFRSFNPEDPSRGGGHIGLFVGHDALELPILYSANRFLPEAQGDGVGLEAKPLQEILEKGFSAYALRMKAV